MLGYLSDDLQIYLMRLSYSRWGVLRSSDNAFEHQAYRALASWKPQLEVFEFEEFFKNLKLAQIPFDGIPSEKSQIPKLILNFFKK